MATTHDGFRNIREHIEMKKEFAHILPYRIVNKKFEFLLTDEGRSLSNNSKLIKHCEKYNYPTIYLVNVELEDVYFLWGLDLTGVDIKLDSCEWTSTILNTPDPLVYTCYVKLKAKLKELELKNQN